MSTNVSNVDEPKRRPPPPPGKAKSDVASRQKLRPPDPPTVCKLDKFGNPEGRDLGLSHDGEFAGKRLLVWADYDDITEKIFAVDNPLWEALERKGFVLDRKTGKFQSEWLSQTDQLWIFSGNKPQVDNRGYRAIENFIHAGKGAYLACDNEPFLAEVGELVSRLFGTKIKGDYRGEQIAYVLDRKISPEQIAKYNATYAVEAHALLTLYTPHLDFVCWGLRGVG